MTRNQLIALVCLGLKNLEGTLRWFPRTTIPLDTALRLTLKGQPFNPARTVEAMSDTQLKIAFLRLYA